MRDSPETSFERYAMEHHHFAELKSTRSYARAHAAEFKPNAITLITTDFQTEGRGQFGRTWISPPGRNLLATYAFRWPNDKATLHLAHLLAFAAIEVLKNWGINPTFKHPNDLLVEGKKIAGTLGETTPKEGYTLVLASIGLNVNMTLQELEAVDQPATSLLVELGQEQDVNLLLEALCAAFTHQLRR